MLYVVDVNGRIFQRRRDAEAWKLLYDTGHSGSYAIKGTSDGRQLWVAGQHFNAGLKFYRSGDFGKNWRVEGDFKFGEGQPLRFALSPASLDVWALVSTSGLIHGRAAETFPRITHARLAEQPPGFPGARLELRIEGRPGSVLLKGGGERDFSLDQLQTVSRLKVIQPQKDSDVWAIEFDPESQDVGLEKGEDLYAEITLETAGFRQAFTLPLLSYKPWRPHPLVSGYAAWIVFLALLLLVWPVGLLKLQSGLRVFDVSRLLEPIPVLGPPAVLALGAAGALPLFARTGRALDTWVRAHRETIRVRFEAEESLRRSGDYVPLPVRTGSPETGGLLDRPDAPALSRLFSRRRTLIQVVGVGGAGKTMLAVQIARWALAARDEGGLERNPMLPVLVDEDTDDLRAVVKRKLTSWLQEEIGDEFLDALLRKQRVLVIVDRVSERQRTTREHLRTLHGGQPVNALLVTTRQPLDFEAGGDVRIYPQPLGSETLLHFMTSLLQEPARAGAFARMGDQLELGKKLADLIRLGAEEVPLTPLLVRLYVDKAVELARRPGASLDELPGSIPDVYFAYLRSVNPDTGGSTDRMSNEDMLRAAEVLARLALGKAFVPREVAKEEAREAFAEAGWGKPEDSDPIRRLRDNGVLQETAVGTEMLLRFALDPVAEFLAAMAHARQCAGNETAWNALFKQVEAAGQRAAGFRLALRLVCRAYGERLGWAMPVEKL